MKFPLSYLTGRTLRQFMQSERAGGIALVICTVVSLLLANSPFGTDYISFWDNDRIHSHSMAEIINDGLMAVFFLLVGLELLQEIKEGELSNLRRAVLPIAGALGGMLAPAAIYLLFNASLDTRVGFGIPMATDIAFALGALSLLGKRVPLSLKVFLTALAVIDDLGAIVVIALFYSSQLSLTALAGAAAFFAVLLVLNKKLNVQHPLPYIVGGIALWYCMMQSGVHATLAGVLLAIAVPLRRKDERCLSNKMQNALHKPVAFLVLPLFALANTAIPIEGSLTEAMRQPYALGIIAGLMIGKPLGITLFCYIMVRLKVCLLPRGVNWKEMTGAGIMGGIGFTMSIFITMLAFGNHRHLLNDAKLMILLSSCAAGVCGLLWLAVVLPKVRKK